MIDHLVYCVPDLEKAVGEFEKRTGMRPAFGGYHTTQGTKNALIRLSDRSYLEFLAADEDNQEVKPPRWMGIDLLQGPKLTRWALASARLPEDAKIVQSHNPRMGRVTGGQRTTATGELLRWQIAMPLEAPEVEVVPFLLDWSQSSAYPADGLEKGCRLSKLELYHPRPRVIERLLAQLSVSRTINGIIVLPGEPQIRATLETPGGAVVL